MLCGIIILYDTTQEGSAMKLGIAIPLSHTSPEEWAEKHRKAGLSSVVFPIPSTAAVSEIDAYVKACRDFGLTIAEVGIWKNVLALDEKERSENIAYAKRQLELAEYIGAHCCVNITGAKGELWDGGYKENYSEETYEEIVTGTQKLIDSVNPKNTCYALEPMSWMHPDSPEDYLQMVKDIDRAAFGVHLDMVNMISSPQRYFANEAFTDHTIALLGKRIKSCHIKDVVLVHQLPMALREVPCGEGGFNLKHYIERINELDPDMPVIIEHLEREEQYLDAVTYLNGLFV